MTSVFENCKSFGEDVMKNKKIYIHTLIASLSISLVLYGFINIATSFLLSNKASDEVTNILKSEIDKASVPIKKIMIESSLNETVYSLETHDGIEIELTDKSKPHIIWMLQLKCDVEKNCEMYMSDETAQTAREVDFIDISKKHVAKLVRRLNLAEFNTK